MKCLNCDSEIPEDQEFCPNCKAPAKRFCPNCGRMCSLNDKFCEKCGHNFFKAAPLPAKTQPEIPSQKPQPELTPQPPQQLSVSAEKEIEVLKHVTVLIVSMKNSPELMGKMGADEIREIQFPAMQKLASIVYEYDGTVVSTAVDGLIAVFGATQALENHAMRSCLAAQSMQSQFKSMNVPFVLRIILNTGEIPVSLDGSKYDVVSAIVTLAARMQQMAKPGTILLTRNTLKRIEENVTVESLGKQEVKGFAELIEAFELKEVKVGKSLNVLENKFPERTRFVNREQEAKQIESLLMAAKAGKGNTVGICSNTGIGKSRFTYEFLGSKEAKECNVLLTAGSGFIHTKSIPLLPVKNLFLTLFGILKDESNIEIVKAQIKPFLAKINTPKALEAALTLIHLVPTDPEWNAFEPGLKRKYTFDVGAQILFNYSLEKPLILVFEDLHWVDSESELFIDFLITQVAKWKIFLIISFRLEYKDRWTNTPNYTRIMLKPLTNEACSTMLDNILGTDPSLTEIKKKLLETAKGNPFFLEEIVLSFIKDKIFVGKPQKYHLRELTILSEIQFPESIIGVYQTKVDSLPPTEKKILQIASVIGTKFLYSQLTQLMDVLDEGEVRTALNKLSDDQYIYESQLYPEPGFSFTNQLTQETAYNSLLKKTRKTIHLKFFQILEATLGEDQIDQVQIIAEHAYLGENWEKAFYYYVKAAEKVYEINAFTASAQLYEKSLITAEHLPQTEELILKIMRIHYALYYVYVPLGRFKKQQEHLDKALEIALAKKDRFFESLIHSAICIHYMGYKNVTEAFQHAEKAYQIAKELQSKDAIAIAQFSLVNVHFFLGQFKEIVESDQDLEKTTGDLDFRSEWLKLPICQLARMYESWTRSFTGEFDVVEGRQEKWFAESKDLTQPNISNVCRFGVMGMNYYLKGDFAKGIEYTLTTLQYSLAAEVFIFAPVFFALLSNMYLRTNKIEEGKLYLARSIAMTERISAAYVSAPSMITISECLLLIGESEKAKEYCNMAMKIVLERQIIPIYALLLRVSAEIDLAFPNPNYEEIERKLQESLGLLSRMKMWIYVARCHFSYGLFCKKKGDAENKDSHFKSALEIYEKYKVTYWIEQVKAQA